MKDDPIATVGYLLWGIGTIIVFSIVVRRRHHSWQLHHDPRSRRELIAASALYVVAWAAGLSIVLALLIPPGTGIRGFFVFTALGMFTAAGIVMATEKPTEGQA